MNYEICGKTYPVIGHVTTRQTGRIPLVELPMMSDEQRHELARPSASVTVLKPEKSEVLVCAG